MNVWSVRSGDPHFGSALKTEGSMIGRIGLATNDPECRLVGGVVVLVVVVTDVAGTGEEAGVFAAAAAAFAFGFDFTAASEGAGRAGLRGGVASHGSFW
jgi:hypothetical protein